jgi:hypothetical protein
MTRPIEQVLADFNHGTTKHPFRCAICHEMQDTGSTYLWVGDGSTCFKKESYRSTVIAGRVVGSRSAACVECVRSRP